MRNFYKYFKRIEVTKGMLYVMYAVAFYRENRDNVDKWQIKQIQPIICNTNTKYINCITQRYSQKCVIIFDPKEPILRHMKSYRDKFVFLSFPKGTAILRVVNMKNLSNELKYYNKESIYVFLNDDYLEHYKTITDLSLKCYIMPKLLCNMNFAEKSSAIAKINKILTENFCWRNCKRLENYGIDIVRSKYALTIHNKPFVHDDMAFSFTHLNKHKYFSDLDCAISVYRAFHTMFFDKVSKITAYKDKIEFIDDVVTSALRILLNNNIVKKEVDLLKYPEIVSYLFPGKFLDTDKDYLSYDEMIRFCCSFTRLKHFIGFQEYFNAQNVEYISARLPEIYFSYIITRNTK